MTVSFDLRLAMKTPARRPAFQKTVLSPNLLAVVGAVFPANVMAVNPSMTVVGPMSRDPNHSIVPFPITRAMVIVWPVANLDFDASRSNRGGKKDTRRNNCDEQKFIFDHNTTDSCGHPLAHGFIAHGLALTSGRGGTELRSVQIGSKGNKTPGSEHLSRSARR